MPIYWIIGALILVGLLLGFIILAFRSYVQRIRKEEIAKSLLKQRYQDELLKSSIEIQERERARIAADIHDGIIGQLYVISLENQDPLIGPKIQTAIQLSRSVSHDLVPPLLESLSLFELLDVFLESFHSSFEIEMDRSGLNQIEPSTSQKLHVYRLFQELVVNIRKHAESPKITVLLRSTSNYHFLVVKDSGKGFDTKSEGLGMKNIALRAKQLKATYKFKTNSPKGTSFLLIFKSDAPTENSYSR